MQFNIVEEAKEEYSTWVLLGLGIHKVERNLNFFTAQTDIIGKVCGRSEFLHVK